MPLWLPACLPACLSIIEACCTCLLLSVCPSVCLSARHWGSLCLPLWLPANLPVAIESATPASLPPARPPVCSPLRLAVPASLTACRAVGLRLSPSLPVWLWPVCLSARLPAYLPTCTATTTVFLTTLCTSLSVLDLSSFATPAYESLPPSTPRWAGTVTRTMWPTQGKLIRYSSEVRGGLLIGRGRIRT